AVPLIYIYISHHAASSYLFTLSLHDALPILTSFVKRGCDIVAASCVTVLFSPLWLLVAVAIKLTDRGRVFYVQTRVGELGKPFRSEEHTSELQSRGHLVCRLLLEKKNTQPPT